MNGRGSVPTPPRTAGFLGALSIFLAILTPVCWGAEATLEERLQRLEDRVSRMNLPRISGYIQGQYDAQQKDVSGMRIRRMRLAFTQSIVEKLDAEIEFALPKPDVNHALEYAFITCRWTESLSGRAGRFKTVFGREEPMPTTKLPYVEKALLSDVLSHEIDQGIDVTASSPFGDLSVAVVNGQNKNAEANNRKDVVGRLGARPFHRVSWAKGIEFGLSGHHGLKRKEFVELDLEAGRRSPCRHPGRRGRRRRIFPIRDNGDPSLCHELRGGFRFGDRSRNGERRRDHPDRPQAARGRDSAGRQDGLRLE